MAKFSYKPQSEIGIASNDINVYKGKRIIGYIESKYLPQFKKGNYSKFRPVSNWRNTFSRSLKIELGLIKENPNSKTMAKVSKKKVAKKRIVKKRVAKKKVNPIRKKRVVKKVVTQKPKYWVVVKYPNNTVRYFDGLRLTPNSIQKACFDSLRQAGKVARAISRKVNRPVAVHSSKAEKKK